MFVGLRWLTRSSAFFASAVSICMTVFAPRGGRGRRVAAELQHLRRRAARTRSRSFAELGVVFQVVVAIGQPEPALAEDQHVLRRVLEVGRRAEAEEPGHADGVHVADDGGDVGFCR